MAMESGTMIPALQYQNAVEAINWLTSVLGFEEKLVVPGENGSITHAQLTLGAGMIMLSSKSLTEYGRNIKSPIELEGINTQSPYIFIEEIEAHYNKAVSAGANIMVSLREEAYGGKYYMCKDLEGYIWSFGSYDPSKS